MTDEKDVRIRIVVDNSDAKQGFSEAAQAEKKFQDQTLQLGKQMDDVAAKSAKLGNAAAEAGKAMGLVVGGAIASGILAIGVAYEKTFRVLDNAVKVENLSRAFNNLQKSVGGDAAFAIDRLRESTQGLISDLDLFQAANQAVLLGLDNGSSRFQEMAGDAVKLGEAVGLTAAQSVETLTEGIGRQSSRLLTHLGIIVKADEVYQVYANSINTTVKQLTDEQKELAFSQAAFEAVRKKVQELGTEHDTAAKELEKLTAAQKNNRDAADAAFSSNEDLTNSMKSLREATQGIDLTKIASFFAELASLGVSAAAGIKGVEGALVSFINQTSAFDRLLNSKTIDTFNDKLDGVVSKLENIDQTGKEGAESAVADLNSIAAELQKQAPAVQFALKSAFDGIKEQVLAVADSYHILKAELYNANTTFGPGNATGEDEFKKQEKLMKDAATAAKKYQQELEEITRAAQNAAGVDAFPKLTEEFEHLVNDKAHLSAQEFEKEIESISKAALAAGVPIRDLIEHINQIKENPVFGPGNEQGELDRDRGIYKEKEAAQEASQRMLDELESGLGNAVAEALQGVLNHGDWKASAIQLGQGIGQTVGSVAGASFGGPFGAAIGSVLGSTLGKRISSELTSSDIKKQVFGAIDTIFPGVGTIADHLFGGGKSQGSKDRRALDKYFNDLFDHTHIQAIINGQLNQIHSFDFAGNQDKTTGIFAGLGEKAKEEFGAVGDAITLLQGKALDLGINLDAVLANNLGGDLENLNALLEQMGVSFEDLGNQIITSFLQGDLSIEKAYEDLKQLDDLAHGGGFVTLTDAYNTFQQALASGEGSQQLIDSIRGIGVQAQQLGLKTLPQLADYLANTLHLDAQQIQQFMQAITAEGVKNVNDLVNVSTAGAITIAHNTQTIAAGGTPSAAPNLAPNSNYTPPTNFTNGSYSSSSAGSRSSSSGSANAAAQAAKQAQQTIQDLVTKSDEYLTIQNSVAAGTITQTQAGHLLKGAYSEASAALHEQTAAENAYAKAVENRGKISDAAFAKITNRLNEANAAVENFGKFDFSNLEKLTKDTTTLGLFAQATGQNFDDLNQKIVDAFKSGQETASQAAAAIKKITDAQNGNIDGVGNTGQAFKNFEEGGVNGGAYTLSSFKSIFSEGQELNFKTLGELQNNLNSQFDPAQVSKLFKVLYDSGVSTFDDISKLSDSSIIGIIDKLNQTQFPFQQTSDRVKNILDQMNALTNTNHQVNVTLNLSTKGDKSALAILKTIAPTLTVDNGNSKTTASKSVGGKKKTSAHARH